MKKESTNIPKKRFPEFKNEWKFEKFDYVATGFTYGLNAAAAEFDGKNKYIRITDIDASGNFSSASLVSPDCGPNPSYLVAKNDILLARTGASVGKSYLYDEADGELYFAGFLIRASIKPAFNPVFIYEQLKNKRYNDWVKISSMRSGQPGINAEEYKSFQLAITCYEEQCKISNFFDLLKNRIKVQEQIIENLKQLKKGYMQKIFSQQLRFKDENGEDFPEWEEVNLSKVTEIKTGSNDVQDSVINGKYPFFDRGATIKYLDSFNHDHEAIIYAGEGSEFLPRYHNGKYALHQRCYTIHNLNIEGYLKYIHHYLTTKNNHFLSTSVGTTVKSLRMQCFDSCIIQLPSKIEQLKILTLFDLFDKKLDIEKQKLIKLQKLKSGYLQQMFV